MGEFYMGQELNQPELPANSPRPAETPPDGVIVTDISPDGWTRRYLYTSYMGQAEELLINEIPPAMMSGEAVPLEEPSVMSGAAIPITEEVQYAAPPRPAMMQPPQPVMQAPPPMMQPVRQAAPPMMQTVPMRSQHQPVAQPSASMSGYGRVPSTPLPEARRPVSTVPPPSAPAGSPQTLMLRNASEPIRLASAALGMSRMPTPAIAMGGPTGLMQQNLALHTDTRPRIGPAGLGASERSRIAAPQSQALVLAPRLGQIQPVAASQPPPPPPPPPSEMPSLPVATKCPGPVEMTDGHVIEPDDLIKLSDLCELVPFLMAAELQAIQKQAAAAGGKATGLAPGQPLSLVGQSPSGMSSVAAGSPFGGQGGGGGGGGFGGFGGGGGPGPAGPPGAAGLAGPPGPPGPGTATDFLVKTDGDFTVGPGGFVPVPGTLLAFSTPADGAAIFLLQAVLGCGNSQNAVLGLRIDGTDFPLNPRLLHTFAGGVGEFFIPAHASFPVNLTAGAHTVEVILRGIGAGEFCSAAGIGFPATVSANPGTPLALTVLHQGPAAPPPASALLVVEGINKMDGNFTSASVVPVPGTSLSFMVTNAGNALFAISGSLDAVGVVEITNAILGIRIDGVDYNLAQTSEQQGSGDDHFNVVHLAGSLTLPMTPGPHTAQLLFGNVGGVNQFALHGSADHPATLSVVHP